MSEVYTDEELDELADDAKWNEVRAVVEERLGKRLGDEEFRQVLSDLLEQHNASLEEEREAIEYSLGRRLTAEEDMQLAELAEHDLDVDGAYESYKRWTAEAHDMDTASGRQEFYTQRLADAKPDLPIRHASEYDLSDDQQRVQYMADRMDERVIMEDEA